MRRTRLIWFAAGAATSAMAFVLTHLFVKEPEQLQPYLTISERPLHPNETERMEDVAQTSGMLLRECKAKKFIMKTTNGVDGIPYSLIKINQENDIAIHCVFERAAKEGFPLHIQVITDRHAQTH